MWLDASWKTSSQAKPISIKLQNKTTNQTLDGPALTLTGVRLTGLMVKSFFLRTLDLGMSTFTNSRRHRCDDEAGFTYEVNVGRSQDENATGER